MLEYKYGKYKLKFTYRGGKASPFDSTNKNNFVVTITNDESGNFCHVDYWDKVEMIDEKRGAEAFVKILQTSMIGMLNPLQFCAMMDLDPEDELRAKPKFEACRAVTEQVAPVVTEDYRLIFDRMARKQGLEIARRKS